MKKKLKLSLYTVLLSSVFLSVQASDNSNLENVRVSSTISHINLLPIKNILQFKSTNDLLVSNSLSAVLFNNFPIVTSFGSIRPGGQSLNILGLEDVKITVDGVDNIFKKYRQGSLFISPEFIKSISVIKGPFDVTKGNGGFAGSTDIETKDATDYISSDQNLGFFLSYGYQSNGKQNKLAGSIYYVDPNNKYDVIASLNSHVSSNLTDSRGKVLVYSGIDKNHSVALEPSDYLTNYGFALKANAYLNDNLSIQYTTSLNNRNGNEAFASRVANFALFSVEPSDINPDVKPEGLLRTVYRISKDSRHRLKVNYFANKYADFNFILGYSNTSQDDKRPDNAPSSLYSEIFFGKESYVSFSNINIELNNSSSFEIGESLNTLTVGLQSNYNYVNTKATIIDPTKGSKLIYSPAFMPSGVQKNSAIYISNQFAYGKFIVTPSIRYDNVENSPAKLLKDSPYGDPSKSQIYEKVSYSFLSSYLSLELLATDYLTTGIRFSKTSRAPSVDEQYSTAAENSGRPGVLPSKVIITGTSLDLKPETALSVAVDVKLSYSDIYDIDDKLELNGSFYNVNISNEIRSRSNICKDGECAEGYYSKYANYNTSKSVIGYELGASYTNNDLYTKLNYTLINGSKSGTYINPYADVTTDLNTVPPSQLKFIVGYNLFDGSFKIGAIAKAVSAKINKDTSIFATPSTKGYALVDIFANWYMKQVPGLAINLGIDNLFNKGYSEFLGGIYGSRDDGKARSFKFAVSYKF